MHAGGAAGITDDTRGKTFDPDIENQDAAKGYTLFYERLLAYNLRTYAVEPEIAQKWEQPSPTDYVFHLQPGVKWQNKPPVNGRPLTVDDVVWSLERARTNDPRFISRSYLASVDRIEAPDKATVRITTKGPDAVTLKKLSDDNLAILAREVIEKYAKLSTAEAVVGTGPFVMKTLEEGVGAEYVRNPDYWKPGLPYLDGFRTKDLEDSLAAWSAFLSGQLDVALAPGSAVEQYLAKQAPGFSPDWFADDTVAFLYPNLQRKPMDDARIVRALRLLIDHDEFIKAWAEAQYGRGRYGSIFPTALSAWDLTDDEYRSHLEWKQPKDAAVKEGLALLSAAGFSKESPLRFTLDALNAQQYQVGAQLVQAQWQRLGQGVVDIKLNFSDSPTALKIKVNRSFTYAYFGNSGGLADPDAWLSASYHSGGSLNFMGLSDSKLDAMIDKQRTIFDEPKRKLLVKQIVQYMIGQGPSVIPANRYILDGVQSRVRGHVPEYHMNAHQYQSVWLAS